MKDWTGNNKSAFICNGASNHTEAEREENDFYATDPRAVELLCELESFNPFIWEPACGKGHISDALKANGYTVISSDIINRGYSDTLVIDFLNYNNPRKCSVPYDIITNPPYKYAYEFLEKALQLVEEGHKVAMFLKLTFLEGKRRKKLFERHPPKVIYVSSSRIQCAKNGEFKEYKQEAIAYAWFIWEKGYKGEPVIRWFN